MTDLDDKARRLLDLARQAEAPSAADADRIRAALEMRLALDPTLLTPAAATKAAGTAALLLKEVLIALGVGGALGLGAMGAVALRSSPPKAPATTAVVAHQPISAPARGDVEREVAELEVPLPEPELAQAVVEPRVVGKGEARAARDAVATSPNSARDELTLELAALRRAQGHLHRGDPAEALSVLAELEKSSPSRVLDEEREATRLMARCASGARDEAAVAAYVARFPKSVHRARVAAACGEQKKSDKTPTESGF